MSQLHRRRWFATLLCVGAIASGLDAQTHYFRFDGEWRSDHFGGVVASAGDVDADGVPDLLVGAHLKKSGSDRPGAVYVYSGAHGDLLYTFLGDQHLDAFGASAAAAGDVNRDGFGDVIVGASSIEGYVRVFSGADGSILHELQPAYPSSVGTSVAGVGDVDRDGFDDVAVGAEFGKDGNKYVGRVTVYSGADGSIVFARKGEADGDQLGHAVCGLGDVNDDGIPDIATSAPDADDLATDGGVVLVISGADGSELYRVAGGVDYARFGWSLSETSDLSGDGRPDLLVGAPFTGKRPKGAVFVYSGHDGTLLYTIKGSSNGGWFGESCSSLSDLDGDGLPELVVGAPRAKSKDGYIRGSVHVHSGADGSRLLVLDGEAFEDEFGISVAGVGDLDGDGNDEILVGAHRADSPRKNSGAAYVYLGGLVDLDAYGAGSAGSRGHIPLLSGTESLPSGGAEVRVDHALGGAAAMFWIGSAEGCIPYGGGKFLVDLTMPFAVIPVVLKGPSGKAKQGYLDLPVGDVSELAGLELFLQCTVLDAGAAKGIAFSNGLKMTVR